MQPVEQDLKFIESTCHDLNDYVLSDLLYWPVTDEPYSAGIGGSRATIGLLRLIIESVRFKQLNQSQTESLQLALETIEKVQRKWAVAWGKKVIHEFKARLRQWHAFITESQSDPREFRSRYRSEVRNRVILQLLKPDLTMKEAGIVLALSQIDEWLKGTLAEGDFIWEEDLAPAFPADKFWFLYRNLKA